MEIPGAAEKAGGAWGLRAFLKEHLYGNDPEEAEKDLGKVGSRSGKVVISYLLNCPIFSRDKRYSCEDIVT